MRDKGATLTEYAMVVAMIGLIIFAVAPLLLGSAKSLYSRNQNTYNTVDTGPFYNPSGSAASPGNSQTGASGPIGGVGME